MLSLPKHLLGSLVWYVEQARLQGGIQNAEMASGKDCQSPGHLLYCLKSSSGHLFLSLAHFLSSFPAFSIRLSLHWFYCCSWNYQVLVCSQLKVLESAILSAWSALPPNINTAYSFTAFKWLLKYHFLRCYLVVNQIFYCFLSSTHHLTSYQLLIYSLSLRKQKFCLLCAFTIMSLMPRTFLTHSR